MEPDISVVIPTYNEDKNIATCLELLDLQMKSSDEVIIVDGGSTDDTRQIAEDLGATVYVAEDAGIGLSRHIGVTQANNEVIATTDADARPPENWIPKIREHFANDPELSVLWGSIEDLGGKPIRDLTGKFSTLAGGASGNNTAYRKEHYIDITDGYPDMDYAEDAFIIYKLALAGKAVRDKDLIMVMDMERLRYQTIPIVTTSIGLLTAGMIGDGKYADAAKGASLGLVLTEFLYEEASGTPLHHDEVGMAVVGASISQGSPFLAGVGTGLIGHHAVTEGISTLPTVLHRETDVVVGGNT